MFLWHRDLLKKKRRAVWCLSSQLVKRHISPVVYFYHIAKYTVRNHINSGGQSPCKVCFCSHVFCFNQGIVNSMLLIWRQVEGKQGIARGEVFPAGWQRMWSFIWLPILCMSCRYSLTQQPFLKSSCSGFARVCSPSTYRATKFIS